MSQWNIPNRQAISNSFRLTLTVLILLTLTVVTVRKKTHQRTDNQELPWEERAKSANVESERVMTKRTQKNGRGVATEGCQGPGVIGVS